MKKLNEINGTEIKTIFERSYREREKVSQFGQTIDNPNLRNVHAPDLIDTLDLLIDLYNEADKVYDLTAFDMHSLEGTNFEWLEDYKKMKGDFWFNTYNWSAPLTNDLDIKVYKVEKDMFLQVAVHNGWSDARAGYMIEFMFKFDTSYLSDDWSILLSELPSAMKSFDIDGYEFRYDFFSESGVYSVYKMDGTFEEAHVYIGDYDDCVKWLEERKEAGL
jgi:hypothetical protein